MFSLYHLKTRQKHSTVSLLVMRYAKLVFVQKDANVIANSAFKASRCHPSNVAIMTNNSVNIHSVLEQSVTEQ